MNIIYVNGRMESVNDIHDGIDIARDTMGEDWYSFMRQEVSDIEETWNSLDEEVQEYRHSEESIIEEYQDHLHEIQDLAEQCIKEEVLTGPTTKRMQKIYEYLDAIKNICFKNT